VALVFTGLVLGLLHVFEAPHLTKALLFNVFLPGLLFEAAFHIEFKQFWRNRLTVNSLALPGVVAVIALESYEETRGLATMLGSGTEIEGIEKLRRRRK
jgi:NhaP-type Na+/H+ or K+/H+ antiporter